MAKFKPIDREQCRMITINFNEQIIPGTFEHTIDYLIDNKINLESIISRYNNDENGSTAYSPAILLKIILLAYSRGVITSRKIETLCRENILFMALTGGLTPDHSTIAKFLTSLANDIKNIFTDILLVCEELKLLGGTDFAIDGCKFSSNASKEWSGTFSDLKKKKEKFDKTVQLLIKNHKKNDRAKNNSEDKNRIKKQIEKIKKKSEKINNFLNENEPKLKSRKGEKQSNLTDNESVKMKTSHGVIQGYNGIAISDSKHQIIINAEAFGSGHEHELLKLVFEGTKRNIEKIGLGTKYFKDKRIIADTGSFCEENLKYLAEENVDAYIPDQQFRKRDVRFTEAERFKTRAGRPDKLYSKEDFTYNKKDDTFTCPAGHILKFTTHQKFNNTEGKKYIGKRSFCSSCTLRTNCVKSDKTRYRTLYVIDKFFGKNYSEEMKAKIDTEDGRNIYSRRMGIIEPVFGNIRSAKGMDRFTLRTKKKIDIQWILFCLIHNTEKIFKYGNLLSYMKAV